MGWESKGSLSGFVQRSKEAVDPALRQIADDGGRFMTQRVIENTPVETSALRDSIRQKAVLKVETVAGPGWESGAFTEVLYGLHVEEGTGLWGPKHAKYRIEPKDPDGVLAFYARVRTPEGKPQLDASYNPVEGQLVFARYVMHPGSPGQHMFALGATVTEASYDEIAERGLQEWKRRSEA
jgi:hypothetical protein